MRHHLALGATGAAFALVAVFAVAPPAPPTAAAQMTAYIKDHGQKLAVSDAVAKQAVSRDTYTATPAIETYVNGGTNYDWAKLVLLSGHWPVTANNVTVLTRWMRQENGPPNWWNRDNPLNNGFGSGGGAGTGNYPNLVVAAQDAAKALHAGAGGGYDGIVAALASSASTKTIEHAIWASNWATSHYENGAHWAYTPVPVVKAPASAW